jgi:hypothetical protein
MGEGGGQLLLSLITLAKNSWECSLFYGLTLSFKEDTRNKNNEGDKTKHVKNFNGKGRNVGRHGTGGFKFFPWWNN